MNNVWITLSWLCLIGLFGFSFQAYAKSPKLASPVLIPFEPDDFSEMDSRLQPVQVRNRDNETLSCRERFPNAETPNCFDETRPTYVKTPMSTCPAGYEVRLKDAGNCETPCHCEDIPKSSEKFSSGKRSVVLCQHPRTQWECWKSSRTSRP